MYMDVSCIQGRHQREVQQNSSDLGGHCLSIWSTIKQLVTSHWVWMFNDVPATSQWRRFEELQIEEEVPEPQLQEVEDCDSVLKVQDNGWTNVDFVQFIQNEANPPVFSTTLKSYPLPQSKIEVLQPFSSCYMKLRVCVAVVKLKYQMCKTMPTCLGFEGPWDLSWEMDFSRRARIPQFGSRHFLDSQKVGF